MSSKVDQVEADEPWEADISALLGSLPDVEPPEGFLAAAIDHPPLHAGRILAALVGGAVLALTVLVAVVAAPPGSVIPQLDALTSRHAASRADLLGGGPAAEPDSCGPTADCDRAWEASQVDVPVTLPDGYRAEAGFAADDLEQAVYARNGDAVSVFVQPGVVDWSRLPAEGQGQLGDVPAWLEPDDQVAVLQVGDEVVTIVGLGPEDVADLVAGWSPTVPDGSSGAGRAREVLVVLAEQLGLDVDR